MSRPAWEARPRVLGQSARLLAALLPVALGVATVVFALSHLMPGDPVAVMLGENAAVADREALRRQLGLNQPLHLQYISYLGSLAQGDLGHSIHSGRPVASLLAQRAGATLELSAAAVLMTMALALPLGLIAALRPRGIGDRLSLTAGLAGVAIPNFWLGPMLIMLFSVKLGWLPVSGRGGPAHLLLPAFTLGASMAGILARMTRSALLEALGEDYIRTALAKGLSRRAVLVRHALRNALTPVLSVAGLELGALLTGSVITETIFSWPGIGRLMLEAIHARDYPVLQGCVLVFAAAYVVVNLVTDLAYLWANPRLRVEVERR